MERIFKLHPSCSNKIMANGVGDRLSAGCITFLKDWYADSKEEIDNKYTRKGTLVEDDLIDFAVERLGLGLARKNTVTLEDDYFEGTCDVDLPSCIIDVKAAWSYKTLLDIVKLDPDYKSQLKIYLHLYKKTEGIVFHGLLNTPAEANYGNEVLWEHIPPELRWIAFKVEADYAYIAKVQAKILKCRAWLIEYDKEVKARIGKIYEEA